MTIEKRIADLTNRWKDSSISREEKETADQALVIIDELEKKLEDLKWDFGELENWKCQLEAENKELKEARDNYKRMWVEGSEWRTIETAPEGKFILASDGRSVEYGNWRNGELWDELGNDSNGFTHWMPLPKPPINKEQNNNE